LIGGCEVVLDVHPLAQQLVDVQHSFLRRLLKVNNRAMIAPLFTETAVIPLQFRRAQLALRYLGYLISLPIGHMAHAALLDSVALCRGGSPCWINDLRIVLLNLPCAVSPPDLALIDAEGIKTLDSVIVSSMKRWLDNEMESPKLYLLQGRLELEKDKPPQHKTLWFRHYLRVPTVAHRRALTRLLLSDHGLAIEQLRRTRGPYIPREHRLCRFCINSVESPEHALLECVASHKLVLLRNEFVEKMRVEMPVFGSVFAPPSTLVCLKVLIANRPTVSLLAKYVHDVLLIFDAHPLYSPLVQTDI
jgi:hypothetical protein